ncbi:uncharacterized protein EV420DRAFT_1640053 [Desarmillaria tabescens]|uniref:F-box domain-containing protein n=1 Tax=Armillaria tabescens TaxID=1929756 RepID=A0AA39NA24_ARMTA|nr:uncharacterized protein EV420DRAFT_1640053 [Desarmillaria tabescens]KAK0461749.1 hypothetical protein EV420DRAFT_1640053 [Desarmillaria tabescens]
MIGPLTSSALRVTAAIDEIQAEILRAEDFLDALEDKRRHLQSIKDDYKTVLSPVRRVPAEVLAEIFPVYSENGGSKPRYNVFDVKAGPWVLSRVCRLWRQVLYSLCPSSWTTFMVPTYPRMRRDPTSLLKAALSRCGNRQLEFIFCGPSWDPRDADMEVRRTSKSLFQILLSLSHRWKFVTLDIVHELFQLLSSVRAKIPCLETCNITTDPITGPFNALEFAPISTSNLVTFSDDRMTDYFGSLHQMYLDIIRDSPFLEELEVAHQGEAEGILPVATPFIVHPALRRLAIREGSFIGSLELPKLASVAIQEGPRAAFPDVLPALHDLIIRSGCSLTSLTITDTLDDDIIPILSWSPQLTNLSFCLTQWNENSDSILQTVVERMAETTIRSSSDLNRNKLVLIPLLEKLSIDMHDRRSRLRGEVEVGFVDSNFVNMLKGRLNCENPLRSVSIKTSTRLLRFSRLDEDDIKQLVKWRDESKLEDLSIESGWSPDGNIIV